MARRGLERPRRQAGAARPVGSVAAAQHERAVGERLDPELAVVRRPAVERRAELIRRLDGVARPGRCVREGIVGGRVQDPRVAAGTVEPLARAHGRIVARLRPAGHQRRETAWLEQARQPAREQLAHTVSGEAAVPEGELGVRRDDVGRVTGDAAEPLADDRLEQAPFPELDVRDAVQGEVEGCEPQRSPVHVRCDDVLRMAGEQERLDPVPRADVERPFDRLPDRQVREHGRGAVDARDAVRSVDVEPVGRDQEVVVGDDAHEPVQRPVALLGETRLDEQLRVLARRHRVAEQQQRDERRKAVRHRRQPAPVHLEVDVREDRLAARVQALRDPGAAVAGGGEHLPQAHRRVGRGRSGSRRQILTFFVRSQPPCTGASSEPSAFCGA